MRGLLAGAGLVGAGLVFHLIEPVARLECRREGPGAARCTVTRSFFGLIPYEKTEVSAAALAEEDRRLGRADPDKVTCTTLTLLDTEGDATPIACVRDAGAITRARAFFADRSTDAALDIRHSQALVTAVAAAFMIAGAAVAAAFALRARGRPRRTRP